MRFQLPVATVSDGGQQQNNQALQDALAAVLGFVVWGDGVPAHTPSAPQVYVNRSGGAGSAVYAWDTTAWVALA